ncbi:efflux RND transporter periplasmic adaptor subunit [Sphingomonas sp.]|uniref:efflux RND transporter periplasmic adaptor subunit n=1 Tax=Sphingomonas sp. TaxID=28214 RepID=UPI001DA4FF50|nr:efflux RND transporter periplasmic adaptor subunit [Sphingomonas sp.]MBX9795697.1 efflux RND transporter periplasmic adaptor subunit [Sphingomonas sp.]
MQRGVSVLAMMLALGLAGCGRPAATPSADTAPPQVRVARVGGEAQEARISGVGTVALRREAQLGFTSAGRIDRLPVNEGDRVHRGQLLAALDTTTVAADLARAQAERIRAAAEYQRADALLKQGWITRPRFDTAKANLDAAEANVRATSFQRGNAVVVSPGNGVVLARLAEPGQVVAAGTPVVVIGEEASGYVLRVPLADRDAVRVTRGAPARVTLAALGGETVTGQVVEVGGRAERATGTFIVEIALPADARLRSGEIGSASIATGGAALPVLKVPAAAVFSPRAGEGFVFVADGKRVRLRRVSVAEADDGGITVTGGIKPGEMVAVSRVDRLKDGMAIAPIGARE